MGKDKRSERASFSEENMTEALRAIQEKKMTFKDASALYGISKTTLFCRLKRVKAEMSSSDQQDITLEMGLKNRNKHCKYASHQVFTNTEENFLVRYLLERSKLKYGLTMDSTRTLAYEFSQMLTKKCPESWEKNKKAGKHWARGFIKRHSEISLRKPENTSLARNLSFNSEHLKIYFDNLQTIMSGYSFPPSRILNLDETGLSTVLQAPRILAATNSKQVGQCVSNERGESITIVGIINAAGEWVPPVYIFPRKRVHQEYMEGSVEGSIALFNAKGYMDSEGFIRTLEHIKLHVAPSKENPILIVLDNHASHSSLNSIKFCRENGIHMVSLPPHTSHKTQPLDLTIFGPFKTFCKEAFNAWLADNPGKRITVHNVARISTSAIVKSFSKKNIISGFAKSGIFPLDRSRIFSELASLENSVASISQDSPAVPTDLEVNVDTSVNLNVESHMPVNIVKSASSLNHLDGVGTHQNISDEFHALADPPSPVFAPSLNHLVDAGTLPLFRVEAYLPVDIHRSVFTPSLNDLDDTGSPGQIIDDGYLPVNIHSSVFPPSLNDLDDIGSRQINEEAQVSSRRSSSPLAQPLDLTVTSPDFHCGHDMQMVLHERSYPMAHGPLDLTVTSPDFHCGHDMQMVLHERSYPMAHGPLDLSTKSLASPATHSGSHTQLRFGGLELLRPIPNPLQFQGNSKVSRAMSSIIVTGSPELKRKEELEMKKNVKKQKLDMMKASKPEVQKVFKKPKKEVKKVPKEKLESKEVAKEEKKRGRPRKIK